MIGPVAIKRVGGYDPNKPRKKHKVALALHPPKWDRVFKLLRECALNIKGGNFVIGRQAAEDARKLALRFIPKAARSETSMGLAVKDVIDHQIIHTNDHATIEGAIACLKRLVAREAALRAVNRYQARLRRDKPYRRSWSEVDRAAAQAIRDVRAELGAEAFSG